MKLGYREDLKDARDWRLTSAVLGAATPARRAVSWLDYCAPVRTQPAQNCVNEALARAVHTVAEIKRTPIAYPSCLANYGLGRQLSEGPDAGYLPDIGSFPRLVMKSAKDFGMVPLSIYDDLVDPTEPVPFDVIQRAYHAKVTGFWRLDQRDENLFCTALEKGKILIIGRTVGQDYLDLKAEVYDGRQAPVAGGHMEAIVGYDLDAPVPYFEVMGSWGTDFARGGIALCSIRSVLAEAYDVYAVEAAPRMT